MKQIITLFMVVIMIGFVSAGDGCPKKCGTAGETPKTACNSKCNVKTTDAQEGAQQTEMCPSVVAGNKCAHPEKCPFSHETTVVKTAVDPCKSCAGHKNSWWRFWGKKDKDCTCKTTNT